MPPSKPKQIADHRRTLTPIGAHIALTANGFEVRLNSEIIAVILWKQVQTIFAYTRFIQGHSNLCLAFVLPAQPRNKENQVVVNDGVTGWSELVAHLSGEFSPIENQWQSKAAVDSSEPEPIANLIPAFTVNPVQVWPVS
jgi:hypothetical protein